MSEGSDNITILLIEDQEIARMGLKIALERMPGFRIVGEAEDGLAAVEKTCELKPAVVVMDIGLPGIDGVEATKRIKKSGSQSRIIVVTAHDSDEEIFSALNAGADGYCLKGITVDQLALAISTVVTGAAWLDPGIAARVLRARRELNSASQCSEVPLNQLTLSKNEQEILCLVEQGLSYDEMAGQLMIDVENIKSYMCQILEKMVVTEHGTAATSFSANDLGKSSRKQGDLRNERESPAGEPPVLHTGMILADRYVIESVLGTGGMSRVYKARHLLMDKIVALKVLHQHLVADKLVLQRFQTEAKTVSVLNHPNIVKVFDFGLSDYGQPFLVMDYVEGQTLEAVIQEEHYLEPDRAVHIFSQVLDGLAAAHARGIIHRDLKPTNIMLLNLETVRDFAMIIDFGIAKIILGDEAVSSKLTPTGEVYGSLAYMSPEQCKMLRADHRTDIYTLGCVMYEALTGKIMVRGSGPYEVITKHLQERPASFKEACPERSIPASLEAIVFKAIEKDPGKRFQSTIEMKEALNESIH